MNIGKEMPSPRTSRQLIIQSFNKHLKNWPDSKVHTQERKIIVEADPYRETIWLRENNLLPKETLIRHLANINKWFPNKEINVDLFLKETYINIELVSPSA